MSTEQKKSAQNRLGYFSEPGYISIGAQYTSKAPTDSRAKNFQMLSGRNRNPKYFSYAGRLFDKDLYQTWDDIQRKWRNEKSKKTVGGNPFKPPNPTKEPSGLGSYFGSFGPKNKHEVENPPKKREPVKHEIRNIITTPAKHGSYGTYGTVLGYVKNFKGIAGEFRYVADPYDALHQKAIERAKARRKQPEEAKAPFRPSNPSKAGGPGMARGFSKIPYMPSPPVDTKVGKKKAADDAPPPFKPSQPPKSGVQGTLNKFPEHRKDEYDAAEVQRKKDLELQKTKMKKVGDRTAFVGMSVSKSTRTPSVFKMNIKLPSK